MSSGSTSCGGVGYNYDYAFPDSDMDTNHTAEAACYDSQGRSIEPYLYMGQLGETGEVLPHSDAVIKFTVKANLGPAGETTPPTVGVVEISPVTPVLNNPVKYSVSASDDSGVARCSLVFDGTEVSNMAKNGPGAYSCSYSYSHATNAPSQHTVAARCDDVAGNSNTGATTTVTIYATNAQANAAQQENPTTQANTPQQENQPAHACASGSIIRGSTSSVYYCGADGKRYVFPSDKEYFSWYSDFSSVVSVSDMSLASMPIGGVVNYRPGTKLIKIVSDPKVYAVSRGGVLRPVADETTAACLFGSAWSAQVVDVSDAYFTNYKIGSAVSGCGSGYVKENETNSAMTINADKNLN